MSYSDSSSEEYNEDNAELVDQLKKKNTQIQKLTIEINEYKKIINDNLNGWSLLIVSGPNDGGVRIFRRFIEENERILDFELKDGNLVDKQTNSTWNFNGEATKGELKGTTLDKPKYLELYLFAWKDFYPKTLLYEP